MKILIPFDVQDIGGSSTFASRFKAGMERRGHEVFFGFREDYDILFLIAQGPLEYLQHARRNKRKIVQRLDGVNYWSVASWKFPLLNAKSTYARHLFADFTVYQSDYSRYCVEKFLGRKKEKSATIYNGVDLKLFSPHGATRNLRDHAGQKIFFTASAFRRLDQIVPIIEAVKIYGRKYDTDYKLVIAGSFGGKAANTPDKHRSIPNLKFLGKVKNHDLPSFERASDVFLHTHLNPPCPNNVIEALAVGLPICGVADGAMGELVENSQNGLLVRAAGDAFWHARIIDTEKFADNLHLIIQKQPAFSKKARQIAEDRFSLDQMLEKYLFVMESLIG
jgi:glycosyltransferase involved in cell wall biosynthesis